MPIGNVFFKTSALVSSVTLFAGFVAFRAGALNGLVTAPPSQSAVQTSRSWIENQHSRPESELDLNSQAQEHSSKAEFPVTAYVIPESQTVMHGSKGGFFMKDPSVIVSLNVLPTVMSSSKAEIGIVIPLSSKPAAPSDNDHTIQNTLSNSGITVGEAVQVNAEAMPALVVLAGSKTITNLIAPSDLAFTRKQFPIPAPNTSKPTDITPLFQCVFSQYETPSVSPMIFSTKSAVLDWTPPQPHGEVIFTDSGMESIFGGKVQNPVTLPTAPSPQSKKRTTLMPGSKSYMPGNILK